MDADNLDFLSDKKNKVDFQKDIKINIDKKSDDEKIVIIEDLFKKIMIELGLDLNDDSLSGTPRRVAKMYVKEIFSGLNVKNKPKVSLFDNHFECFLRLYFLNLPQSSILLNLFHLFYKLLSYLFLFDKVVVVL